MFYSNKIQHFHPCECHSIESVSMKDQDGKKWTQIGLKKHIEKLNAIDEGVE